MAKISVYELLTYIKSYITSRSPGLLELLNAITRARTGRDALELLFSKPTQLYRIIEEHYSSREAALFVLSKLFIRPIAVKLGKLELEDKLLNAIVRDDAEFIEILRKEGVEF